MLSDREYSPTEIRDIVLKVYREVLDNPGLSTQDDFFSQGGDSVRGIKVIHRLHDLLGVRIAVSTLFMRRTADELATEISSIIAE